jgi:hypothetical protein
LTEGGAAAGAAGGKAATEAPTWGAAEATWPTTEAAAITAFSWWAAFWATRPLAGLGWGGAGWGGGLRGTFG